MIQKDQMKTVPKVSKIKKEMSKKEKDRIIKEKKDQSLNTVVLCRKYPIMIHVAGDYMKDPQTKEQKAECNRIKELKNNQYKKLDMIQHEISTCIK